MTAGLALDLARAASSATLLQADEAAGRDPRPAFARSRAVIAPDDLAEAFGLALDAHRATALGRSRADRISARSRR